MSQASTDSYSTEQLSSNNTVLSPYAPPHLKKKRAHSGNEVVIYEKKQKLENRILQFQCPQTQFISPIFTDIPTYMPFSKLSTIPEHQRLPKQFYDDESYSAYNRCIVLHWVFEFCAEYNFSRQCLHKIIQLFDASIMAYVDKHKKPIERSKIQLHAMCATSIALKMFDLDDLGSGDSDAMRRVHSLCDSAYGIKEFIQYEFEFAGLMKYDFHSPTAMEVLIQFLEHCWAQKNNLSIDGPFLSQSEIDEICDKEVFTFLTRTLDWFAVEGIVGDPYVLVFCLLKVSLPNLTSIISYCETIFDFYKSDTKIQCCLSKLESIHIPSSFSTSTKTSQNGVMKPISVFNSGFDTRITSQQLYEAVSFYK